MSTLIPATRTFDALMVPGVISDAILFHLVIPLDVVRVAGTLGNTDGGALLVMVSGLLERHGLGCRERDD